MLPAPFFIVDKLIFQSLFHGLSLLKHYGKMRKRKLPSYRSVIRSRCEERADKIMEVSGDRTSVLCALLETFEEGFGEGYERKAFDLRYQKEKREEKRKKEWQKERDKIIFKGK